MPAIRDGRGKLAVHENVPPDAVPPGPIERRQGSPAPPDDRLPIRRDTASLDASRQRGNGASVSVRNGGAARAAQLAAARGRVEA